MEKEKEQSTLSQPSEKGDGTLIPDMNECSSRMPAEPPTASGEPKQKLISTDDGRPIRKNDESFKQTLQNILSTVVSPETVAKEVLNTPLGDQITYQEAILISQVLKASSGNTQAAVFVRDTSGNKPKGDTEADIKGFEEF